MEKNGPNNPNVFHQFICAWCGKVKDIPVRSDHDEYGWFYGAQRCCSYKCMRELEKEKQENPTIWFTMGGDRVNPDTQEMYRRFGMTEKYMTYRDLGYTAYDSARMAGFSSMGVAQNTLRWRTTRQWEMYQKWKEANPDEAMVLCGVSEGPNPERGRGKGGRKRKNRPL